MSARSRLALALACLALSSIVAQSSFAAPDSPRSMQPTGATNVCALVTPADLVAMNVDPAHGETSTTPSGEGTTSGCLTSSVNPNSAPNQQGQREILIRLFRVTLATFVDPNEEDTLVQTVILPRMHPDVVEAVPDIGSGTPAATTMGAETPHAVDLAHAVVTLQTGLSDLAISISFNDPGCGGA